ncbi:MAG: hypothetical protein ACKOBV_06385 [Candidatus Kapaibacterium sp.]
MHTAASRQPGRSAVASHAVFTRADLWVLAGLLAFVALSRSMWCESSPVSWDAASFWCAATDFDIAADRPHLPGYFLHVQIIRAFRTVLSPFAANLAPSLLWSMLATVLLYLYVRRSHGMRDAVVCTMLLVTNPMLWFYGCVSEMYAFDTFFSLLVVMLAVQGTQRPHKIPVLAAALALGAGVRQSSAVLLLPVALWSVVTLFRTRNMSARVATAALVAGVIASAVWFIPFIQACGGLSSYLRLYATNPPGAVVGPLSNLVSMMQYGLYALLVPMTVWMMHARRATSSDHVLPRTAVTLWMLPAVVMFLFTTYTKGYFLLITALPVVAMLRHREPLRRGVVMAGIAVQILVFLAAPHVMPSMRLALAPRHEVSKWSKAGERVVSVFSMTRAHLEHLREYQEITDVLVRRQDSALTTLSVFVDPAYPLTARSLQPRHPDAQLCMLYTHAEDVVLVHQGIGQMRETGVAERLRSSIILTTREVCTMQPLLRIVEERGGLVLAVPQPGSEAALAAWYAHMFVR